ncbi:hypothetical protein FUAX_04710 [Fulvitalea axinellae]|uniref:DinB family protein n=1 Tax=Fulvitalea axinellae TaxID=1182444 RepID=A0AAU9C7S5_9BACT|nr:hypothetical protein FUAX_04710 [Fulvitalea axinellae]
MIKKTKYRANGAVGALLDEYEKAIDELIRVIQNLSEDELTTIIDLNTKDEDCKSVQTILTHVVQSGYNYIVAVRKWLGEEIQYREKVFYGEVRDYTVGLKEMFKFNEALFADYPDFDFYENDSNKKINARWGQQYEPEQLFEHAIVHVLRHRRQVEIFKERIRSGR